jgi:hypothetical protein
MATGRNHPVFPVWHRVFSILIRHRRFILFQNKYFGFAHQDSQKGDVVVVLGGGKVPYILRLLPTGNYTFIGTAYVQDMMDGEVFEISKELQQFTIV